MKKYRYGIIGRFAEGKNVYGGQTIKTRNFADELENYIDKANVYRSDTSGWKKKILKLVREILYVLSNCEEIVILPADRGVLVIPRLVMFLRGCRKNKIQYVVIGGWLPEFLEERRSLSRCLKKFDGIYVETQAMKNALEEQGFDNVTVLPNFKRINVLNKDELVYATGEPYKLCTFSRVLKEKGIEDAVNAVKAVNDILGRTVCSLDIYGKIDSNYDEEFKQLMKDFPSYIRYMGEVDGSQSVEIIKNYFMLLFPTYFYGEGYPGTLLDAFSAGVPVVASDWRYNREIVGEDKGFLYEAKNVGELTDILIRTMNDSKAVNSKKLGCLEYALLMKPERLIKIFCE